MHKKDQRHISSILLLFLSLAFALFSACNTEKGKTEDDNGSRGLPLPMSGWEGTLNIPECQPSELKIDYISDKDMIVAFHPGNKTPAMIYLISQQKGLIDSLILDTNFNPKDTEMAVWGDHVCIASHGSIGILNFSQNGWGEFSPLNVAAGSELIDLNSEGVTVMVQNEDGQQTYSFAPQGEKLYWEDFTISEEVISVKRNSQGRWAVGTYSDELIVGGASVFPKPREKQMAYLAFAGNYQGNDWGRQIGGIVPGKPRDWQATWPLDLQTDPAGYGWVLWQGELTDPTINSTVLGVNFYDPSGILLKNLVFQAPGRGLVNRSLQLMKNGRLCIHSTYNSEEIAEQNLSQEESSDQEWLPVHSVLIFDRQGNVTLDRSLVLRKGQVVRKALVSDGKLKLTGLMTNDSNSEKPGSGCVIFHDTHELY